MQNKNCTVEYLCHSFVFLALACWLTINTAHLGSMILFVIYASFWQHLFPVDMRHHLVWRTNYKALTKQQHPIYNLTPPNRYSDSIHLFKNWIHYFGSIYRFIKKVMGAHLTSSQRIVGLIPWLVNRTNVTDWLVAHFQEFKSFCWGSLRVKITAVYKNLFNENDDRKKHNILHRKHCVLLRR